MFRDGGVFARCGLLTTTNPLGLEGHECELHCMTDFTPAPQLARSAVCYLARQEGFASFKSGAGSVGPGPEIERFASAVQKAVAGDAAASFDLTLPASATVNELAVQLALA